MAQRSRRPLVSVVIPALNERENLPHVLPLVPRDVHELILVDGASTDGTVDAARGIVPSIRIVHQEGRGKGAALRSGFEAATGDIIVMLDADGSTDPREIPRFVHALLAGADFAKGSRFLHGGGTSDMPLHRRLGNAAFVRMVRVLFGGRYTDLCYGYNAFWRDVLPALSLDGEGFEIETMMNIRALRAGMSIVEVPSFEDRRVMGVGNLRTIPDGWRVLRTIWRERSKPVGDFQRAAATDMVAVGIDSNGDGVVALHVEPAPHSGNGNGNGHLNYPIGATNHGSIAETVASLAETGNGAGSPASAAPVMDAWESLAGTYVERLHELLAHVDRIAISRVVQILRDARDRGATVFIAGNGGSAATAAHWVNDLGKATKLSGRPALRVMNLTDNVPWLTALANDEGYERAFAGQLENFARPDDVLVILSASGNSPNIINALEMAAAREVVSVGLLGFDGGRAQSLVDEAIWVKTEIGAYGLVETAHAAITDIVTACLIADRVPEEVLTA